MWLTWCLKSPVNSLAPGRFELNFSYVISNLISVIDGWAVWWNCPQLNVTWPYGWLVNIRSGWLGPLRQHAITWPNVDPKSVSPYRVIRPKWINSSLFRLTKMKTSKVLLYWPFVGGNLLVNSSHLGANTAESTVKCHYNLSSVVMKLHTILHTALQWQQQNVNEISKSQQTPHTSPSQASYGVSIMRVFEKIDRIITAPFCIFLVMKSPWESNLVPFCVIDDGWHFIGLSPCRCVLYQSLQQPAATTWICTARDLSLWNNYSV